MNALDVSLVEISINYSFFTVSSNPFLAYFLLFFINYIGVTRSWGCVQLFICSIVFTNSSKCNINCVIVWFQPPKIKAFIDKVIQCPLQDIGIPLSGFHLEYSKVMPFKFSEQEFYFFSHHLYAILFIFQGNFHHWRPLFLHFDTFFRN